MTAERETTLDKATAIQERLAREFTYLETGTERAPASLRPALDAMAKERRGAFDAITARIVAAKLPMPVEASPYMEPEPVEEEPIKEDPPVDEKPPEAVIAVRG